MQLDELIKLNNDNKLIGIYDDIPDEVYHHKDCPGYSRSDLNLINKSYLHYLHYKNNPINTTDLEFGIAVHNAILLPQQFEDKYFVIPKIDKRTKSGKEQYSEFEEKYNGKHLLPPPKMDSIIGIRDAVSMHPQASRILKDSQKEISIWVKNDDKLCKIRPDIYQPCHYIADLKTTTDASLYGFRKSVFKYNYDMQAAFYHDCIYELTGDDLPFYFIAVEKEMPYGIAVYQLSDELLIKGREKYYEAFRKITYYDTFAISGYPTDIQTIDIYK